MGLMPTNDPGKTTTIAEFISFKNDDIISYNNISFRDKYDNIEYPVKNIIDDYIDELMELTVEVTLSDKEYLKYRYRPKLLANDVYENPELDFLILRINGVCNMKEFDSKTIKLVKVSDLDEFLTTIYNANKEDMDIYNANSNIY